MQLAQNLHIDHCRLSVMLRIRLFYGLSLGWCCRASLRASLSKQTEKSGITKQASIPTAVSSLCGEENAYNHFYNLRQGVKDLAHIVWVILVLTIVLVYLPPICYAVAVGFVDSTCSGIRDRRRFMVHFSQQIDSLHNQTKRAVKALELANRNKFCSFALMLCSIDCQQILKKSMCCGAIVQHIV